MMKKATKIWLVTASALVLFGAIVFVLAACSAEWDFARLGTGKFENNVYEPNEEFSNISIKTDTADIVFLPSDDGKCKVTCYEKENVKHSVSVTEGTLTVTAVDTRKWYDHVGISFDRSKITVYLPSSEYSSLTVDESTGDVEIPKDFKFESIDISVSTGNVKCLASCSGFVKVSSTTGAVCVENASLGALDISVSTGKVTLSDVTCEGDIKVKVSTGKANLTNIVCKNLTSSGSTGDIRLNNVIVAQKLSVVRSTGDVEFEGSDASEIFVETDTGDVVGSLLSAKVFITETDTGKIRVPSSTAGGRCEITTDTGNIEITIK